MSRDKGKAIQQDLQIVSTPYSTSHTTILVNQEMERLARMAEAEYNAASEAIKNEATEFIRKVMRGANDGCNLTQDEFLAVMKKMNYPKHVDKDLFRMLGKGGNYVTKKEARTLYYIIRSGTPFCSVCEQLAFNPYYCSKCPAAKYAICLGCYGRLDYYLHKRNKHLGEDNIRFFNNTTLHQGR